MKKMKIFEDYIIGTDLEYEKIKAILSESEDVAVVCFENNYSGEDYYLKLLNEEWVKRVILIGAKPTSCLGEKLIFSKDLKEKYFNSVKRVFFIIDTDIDEDVLIPLVQLFDIAIKKDISVGVDNIIGFSNKVTPDLLKTLEALLQEDLYKRYEVVYDYICDELDKKFADNSICQFEGDRCIANRKYYDRNKVMGCCYSFKYNGFKFSDVRLCEHQKDHKCEVKCMGCKLFTCDYLRKRGIRFKLENIPIALAFFNKKQREILRTTFFTTREDVLNKVLAND